MQKIGRYEIKGELGRGGMATVYLAHDPSVSRDVAIKVLAARFLHIPKYNQRFQAEARTVANLEHEAIVPLYDFGEHENMPYLVMRHMRGGTLSQLLIQQGPLSLEQVATLLRVLSPALDLAHRRDIVHRDLKPGNILFNDNGRPFLTDFGVAKLLADNANFTGTNEIIGTPGYMFPEMVDDRFKVDGRGDLYSMGAIIYKLLTGRHPYQARKPLDVALMHVNEPPPNILRLKPQLPNAMKAYIEKAMAKRPDDRYQTARAMYNALADIVYSGSPEPSYRLQTGEFKLLKSQPKAQPAPAEIDDDEDTTGTLVGIKIEPTGTIDVEIPPSTPAEPMAISRVSPHTDPEPVPMTQEFVFPDLTPREELALQVQAESMACIGCNDCMLACPLPETAVITIAELNLAINQPVITNPNVIEFVSACTQCQQCVPVCPADLSRADMVLWNKLKVEDATGDRPIMKQVGENVRPSRWTIDTLAAHLTQIPLFEDVAVADLRRTLFKSTLRSLERGEVLCREGEYHERLYVIIEGAVEQLISAENNAQTRILVLGAGSFHGETAVMADQTESFTVKALDSAEIIEIPKTAVYQLMELSPPFDTKLRAVYSQNTIAAHAQQSPIFKGLPPEAVRELLDGATLRTVAAGHILFHEDGPPDSLYLVRAGFLKASKKVGDSQRVLVYFRAGDGFGAVPILVGGTNAFTVEANTRAELIVISAELLNQVLNKYPSARSRLATQALSAEKVARSQQLAPKKQKPSAANTTQMNLSWTALIDQGVLQGHEVLVIDQNICTNCNNCVDGCGRRHGYSRLERAGLQLGNLLFPTACRHCEDPVCLLCSVNGIVREPNGEISIIDNNCIGCGACADRCPYDNIKMHPQEKPPQRGWLSDLWHSMFGRNQEEKVFDLDHDVPKIAVKCDLCAGYSDYACVSACPVGAAYRIDPVKSFDISDMIIGLEMQKQPPS